MSRIFLIVSFLVLYGVSTFLAGIRHARKVVLKEGEFAVVYSGNSDCRVVVGMRNAVGDLRIKAFSSMNPARQPDIDFVIQGQLHKVGRVIWTTHLEDKAVTQAYEYPLGLIGMTETSYNDCPPLKGTSYDASLAKLQEADPKR